MKKKKQKKTDAAGKYTRPAAGPGGSGPGISSGPYGGAQQLPALQTIPFQPLQIQQEPMQPLPLAPGCERGASRGTKERTPADPAGICGATFEQSENGVASTLPPAGATTGQRGFAQRNGAERRQAPGWEPPLTDPEQPPRVQLLPYRPDPEQPPQVQLLQMQRSVLPYMGRAEKNSGAANWVEKLDWKTPSGAPYTSAPEQGGPSNRMELIMAQRGGGGGGFSPGAGAGRGDAPAPGTGAGGGFSPGTGVGRAGIREPGARPPSVGLLESAGDFIGEKLYGLTEGAADVLDFLADPEKVNNFLYSDFIKDNTMAGLSGFNRSAAQTIDWLLPDVITLDPVQKLLDYYKELGGEQAARAAQTNRDLGMEQAGGLYQSAVQAAPNAVLAALSAGAGGTAQLGSASGSAVSAVVQQALESPAFWTSFLRTAGPSYEEAKAGGASEMEAALYALAGGLTSSGIEVGGGIEKMADKSGGFGMLQTMYEEGGEEAKQDILAKLLAKLLYDHGAEYFSASDEDAVFNPNRAFDAFSGGAALGGLFSAADLGLRDLSRAWSGAGESARPGADGLFTRDEVLKMDRAAVSENYDAIRRSMSLWDKDGRLPESMPERDVVDSQSPARDNGGNASAELNAESAQGETAGGAEWFDIEKIRPQLRTERSKAFFWSGRTDGVGGADIAAHIAGEKDGVTLESTIAKKKIVLPEWDFDDPSSMEAWSLASEAYAEQVSGEIRAVIGAELRPGNIWENIELPRLMENLNVTKITIIDPKTGVETIIFER